MRLWPQQKQTRRSAPKISKACKLCGLRSLYNSRNDATAGLFHI